MRPITEITVVGAARHLVEADVDDVEKLILAAARGSLLEFAWMTEANTGKRIALNPAHVVMLREMESPETAAEGRPQPAEQVRP